LHRPAPHDAKQLKSIALATLDPRAPPLAIFIFGAISSNFTFLLEISIN
jgi:hypothetical protein